MNKRKIGSDYERTAVEYLAAIGMRVVEQNYRTRYGEIDLVMQDRAALVFVEVKYRAGDTAGTALDAIDYRKRRQIVRIALQYISSHHEYARSIVRFDCIGINGEDISYIRNAFDDKGNIL